MREVKHKYHAVKVERDSIKFPSKKEARYYDQLKLRQKAGEVIFFLRQTRFDLPGGIKYYCDFQEFHADGTVHFIDVKGHRTAKGKTKKAIVEDLYPVEIEEV